MLPLPLRLPSEEIRVVRTQGARIVSRFLTAYVAPSSSAETRFAIQVPAKGRKSAVVRNRMKRVLREAVRLEASSFPDNRSVILIPSRHTEALMIDEAREAVREIGHKAINEP